MKVTPTKYMIGYVIVLVLSFAPAVLVNHPAGYLPVLVLLFYGILSAVQLILVRKQFDMEVSGMEGKRFRGDTGAFGIRIENRSVLPVPNIYLRFYIKSMNGKDHHSYPIHLTMSPKEKRQFEIEADFSHIGMFETGMEEILIYDLLGILRLDCSADSVNHVKVLPRQYYLEEFPMSDKALNESNRSVTAAALSGYDYTGVREYAFGDPMKMIQWKLSAHSTTLVTKQMESYTNVGMTAVLDFRVPSYEEDMRLSMLDSVVEAGNALGDYARRNGLDFDLMFFGKGRKRREMPCSSEDFAPFLEDIHIADEGEKCNTVHILREDCAHVHGQSNVVLCTSWLDEEIVSALIFLKHCGKKPMLILLMPELIHDNERDAILRPMHTLQYANINAMVVSSAEGLVMG